MRTVTPPLSPSSDVVVSSRKWNLSVFCNLEVTINMKRCAVPKTLVLRAGNSGKHLRRSVRKSLASLCNAD